ncbi:rhomboid family intramembrane serine protease [Putridiphycobacter roseus]|uniref:Rhomboid family intramembrane serine protease n=1 Tax=Putridiphycobacter roseus TaxID=2219161 RepID=A0A2W1NRX0_9FLAO|nr:rhomboid family intramembrane serine protease [Putridiphycobacter roseus]PZE17388.1 rhomboid family intramembrane serine protease [Putridiphycobacter roseus]
MKITFNSPVVLTFSFLSVLVYILTVQVGIGLEWFTLSPSFNYRNFYDYLKLFTYVFGHVNADHIIGNLSFILLLGPIIEEKYGSKNTLIIIASTALITAILHILFFKASLLGASGIVFAFIILASLVNIRNKEIPITFILVALIFIGKEVIVFFEQDNISQFAHIIGGFIGAFFGFKLKPKAGFSSAKSGRDILKGLK